MRDPNIRLLQYWYGSKNIESLSYFRQIRQVIFLIAAVKHSHEETQVITNVIKRLNAALRSHLLNSY